MITPLTPMDFKRRAARLYPKKVAVVDGDVRFTYEEFTKRVNRLSHALLRLHVGKSAKVAVIAPNTHEMLECFYAIPQIGAVMVPINTRLQSHEMEYILHHSDAEILIVDAEFVDSVSGIVRTVPQLRHVIVVDCKGQTALPSALDYEMLLDGAPSDDVSCELDENQPITINYTSGTTSRPKGVVLTHRNMYLNAANFLMHLRVRHDDVYLHTLPMFHVNGWGGVFAMTAVGATHVCLRRVNPEHILNLYVAERVTLACGAPTVLNMLVQAKNAGDVSISWPTRIATAGSPPPAAIIERVQEQMGMEVIHVYGLTEVSPFITWCEWRDEFDGLSKTEQFRLKACQGVELLFNGETKVVREDGSEVEWDGQEIGEIVARGNVVMDSYYKQPEETAKAIRDGWFHTGDLAVVHPPGYIEIVDRLKDVIISGGENVSSIEVEGTLYQHTAVADVAVVSKPDEQWGEVPAAFVVLKPGMEVSPEELREFARERLAHFKVPKEFHFVSELPRTSTGKLQKFRIREQLWHGEARRVR